MDSKHGQQSTTPRITPTISVQVSVPSQESQTAVSVSVPAS